MTNLKSGMNARWRLAVCVSALAAALSPSNLAIAAQSGAFLDSIHRQTTLTSTVPDNGDQNPYAIVVAPVSVGVIQKDDVLITNFNNDGNLQGLGTTIVAYNPTTKKLTTFASLPRNLAGCPGGTDARPSDCDFLHALLGGKGCSYRARVQAFNADGMLVAGEGAPKYGSDTKTGKPIISYDGGKTWIWYTGTSDLKPHSVKVSWIKE